ncbi:short-chain dehydrogenase/reductase SDR [Schizopora paradoxa]|uniref:Short-chain dehydrogenase/reductase SDR n=1 Tax=Schizopora paradoxa TaxID=27342 RepID=A0A0H2RR08_9AGAM|nr:short-chain dehydrogenase/reductase SDR [Schizopora paradoxa]
MSKIIVFTGATNGLGQAAAKVLASQGHSLAIIARDKQRGEDTIASFTSSAPGQQHRLFLGDLSSVVDVKRLAGEIKAAYPDGIDVLVNNAGNMFKKRTEVEGIEMTIALNHMSYMILTLELKDLLIKKKGRVVNTASWMHRSKGAIWDPEDLQITKKKYYDDGLAGLGAYERSKLYNIMFTRECARRWRDTGVTVNCFDPGQVNTNFGKGQMGFLEPILNFYKKIFMLTPEQGGETLVWLATSDEVAGKSGLYYYLKKEDKITDTAANDEYAKIIWSESCKWGNMPEYL